MANNLPSTAKETMELINKLDVLSIPSHDMVKSKFIQNYNAFNKGGNGEFMYNKNMVYLMQILNSTSAFKQVSPFSVYACMTTIAAFGYSIDPADGHIYLISRDGRLCISKQAGAYLQRLYKTQQIHDASEAVLVYEGDNFTKKNGIIDHEECYKSEKIVGGYVKFTLDKAGTQRHISYRLSDIEGWRAKSPQKDGPNWRFGDTGQPHPGFLRTKIMLHACQEKCWVPGNSPMGEDIFTDVVVEDGEEFTTYEVAEEVHTPEQHIDEQPKQEQPQQQPKPFLRPQPAAADQQDGRTF